MDRGSLPAAFVCLPEIADGLNFNRRPGIITAAVRAGKFQRGLFPVDALLAFVRKT
jgi:hypothetical protein